MRWRVRGLTAEETHALRRAVSADGRTDLVTMHHELDDSPGAWHVGAVDEARRVVAIASLYPVTCPLRSQAQPAVQLQNMAVETSLQRQGIGSAVMTEILRRLGATDAVLLWASARDDALPFYERFGFKAMKGSGFTGADGPPTPHHRAQSHHLTRPPNTIGVGPCAARSYDRSANPVLDPAPYDRGRVVGRGPGYIHHLEAVGGLHRGVAQRGRGHGGEHRWIGPRGFVHVRDPRRWGQLDGSIPAAAPRRAAECYWAAGPRLAAAVGVRRSGRWWYPQGSTLYESTDRGQQWRQAASLSGGRQFAQVDALDASHAWAIVGRRAPCELNRSCLDAWTDRSLLRTVDGGRQWTAVSLGEAQQ